MVKKQDIIAAVATGGDLSAIGVVRVSGPGAAELTDRVFQPLDGRPMSGHPDRSLVLGRLLSPEGELLDLCLCTVSRAPRSYTGEDTAELQCHGSPVVLRCALESLFAQGARQALPGEFTKRAFLNGRLDLTQAEAVIDLIEAETPAAARNAAGQLSGAVSRRAEAVYGTLTDICAHYHAVLDYPDEDIPPFRLAEHLAAMTAARESLEGLLRSFERGRFLEKGIPTAILGKPNVGKSSLLNALLGYDRAIVTDRAGTTRDTLSERCVLGDVTLRLTDTAGLRETDDDVERLGVERARAAAEDAALILAVFDRSRPWEEEDRRVLELAPASARRIAVVNKTDLPARWTGEELAGAFDAVCPLSLLTGEGLETLFAAVAAAFPLPAGAAGELLTNARQAEAVARAVSALADARTAAGEGMPPDVVLTGCEEALAALAELTGRSVRADVTESIFSRFCVGK